MQCPRRILRNPGEYRSLSVPSLDGAVPPFASYESRTSLRPAFSRAFPSSKSSVNYVQSIGGGSSSAGRASVCGTECRGFEPRLPPQATWQVALLLPAEHHFYLIFLEGAVRREQHHVFRAGLGDKHAVKRIAVMRRKFPSRQRMEMSDLQGAECQRGNGMRYELRRRFGKWKTLVSNKYVIPYSSAASVWLQKQSGTLPGAERQSPPGLSFGP